MDTKDWLLFLGPLLGVVIGSFLSASFAFVLDYVKERREARNYLHDRLEQIHSNVNDIPYIAHRLHQVLIKTRFDMPNVKEEFSAELLEITARTHSLRSVIDLFIPEASSEWTKVVENVKTFIELVGNAATEYSNPPGLDQADSALSNSCDSVKRLIENKVRKEGRLRTLRIKIFA